MALLEHRNQHPELDQCGVRTSKGYKGAVIENVAANVMKKNEEKEVVERYYDFQRRMIM